MMKKVVIAGINGFVGRHTAETFANNGYGVVGVGRQSTPRADISNVLDDYHQVDLLDKEAVSRISLDGVATIIHLAGLADVGRSFAEPGRYITENPLSTFNLFEKAKQDQFSGRFVAVSTGAVYNSSTPLPITESSPTLPTSPYAISKLASEDVARYWNNRGVDAVVVRPFNHTGPGQGAGYLLPDLYHSLQSIKMGDPIRVGNIDTRRDYTDVRDIANAYLQLSSAGKLSHETYNVSSGKSLSGRNILSILQKELELTDVPIVVDPARVRPTDIADIRGDSSQLNNDTGWVPRIPIEKTIADFVASQRPS